ncbi:hypothetical protein DFQ28_007558 [Apophysomyces sp. BC1034]|nr:hypothetical protein DFQ28_007558 [Apophysomyces sp. BC1034]
MLKVASDPTQDTGVWIRASEDKDHEDEWEKVYGNYDAAVDNPTSTFYKELSERYPEAKIILTVRSVESWYNSMCKTVFKENRLQVPDDCPEHIKKMTDMIRKVTLQGYWKDGPDREPNKEELCKMFNDRIEEVKRVIPPERLLIMELGEGWERLCKFLGKEIPDEPYFWANDSNDFFLNQTKALEELKIAEKKMAART